MNETNSLFHYGVKGMKWGVIRYKNKQSTYNKKHLDNNTVRLGRKSIERTLNKYGKHKINNSDIINNLSYKGKDYISKNKYENRIKKQKNRLSLEENIKLVNYKNKDSRNCGNCALALELRLRGYDVKSLINENGLNIDNIYECFKNYKKDSIINFEKLNFNNVDKKTKGTFIKRTISKNILDKYNKKNSRGILFFPYQWGGHVINWIIDNKKIKFYDSQNPNLYIEGLFSYYKNDKLKKMKSIRLDNLDINEKNIFNYIKNREE